MYLHVISGIFRNPPIMGPPYYSKLPILFPYQSHIFRDSYGGKGSHSWGPWKSYWCHGSASLHQNLAQVTWILLHTSMAGCSRRPAGSCQLVTLQPQHGTPKEALPHTPRIHVWHIYLHLVDFWGSTLIFYG